MSDLNELRESLKAVLDEWDLRQNPQAYTALKTLYDILNDILY